MTTLNYQLYRATPPEKYATMFLGCYDPASQSLVYSNAGHLPPFLCPTMAAWFGWKPWELWWVCSTGWLMARAACAHAAGRHLRRLQRRRDRAGKRVWRVREERLIELIQLHRDQPLARISEVVTTAVVDWIGGAEQPDDVTLVLARAR